MLNTLLGSLLGTSLSLKVADYEALTSADIKLLPFLDMLATDLNLTASAPMTSCWQPTSPIRAC